MPERLLRPMEGVPVLLLQFVVSEQRLDLDQLGVDRIPVSLYSCGAVAAPQRGSAAMKNKLCVRSTDALRSSHQE
jgi:hypothetical protein